MAPDPAVFAPGGIGESVTRPDGTPKVKGEFDYSSDLWMEGMPWGATLRSPLPAGQHLVHGHRGGRRDAGRARRTHYEDVPGRKVYGMEIPRPAGAGSAWEHVRYQGEPVAIVAADHPETARRAVEKIAVEYEVLDPSRTPRRPWGRSPEATSLRQRPAPRSRRARRRRERASGRGRRREYEIGMQDQAFWVPNPGSPSLMARADGPVHLDAVAARGSEPARAESLDLPSEMGKADTSGVVERSAAAKIWFAQIHACMLALDTGRPVKMMYNREESFFGHVHRHPCKMRYEHGATVTVNSSRQGPNRLRRGRLRLQLHRGLRKRARFAVGPYECPTLYRQLRRLHG